MKTKELTKLLKENGCEFHSHGKKHDVWINKDGKKFRVDRHGSQEMANGTLNKILKEAGIK